MRCFCVWMCSLVHHQQPGPQKTHFELYVCNTDTQDVLKVQQPACVTPVIFIPPLHLLSTSCSLVFSCKTLKHFPVEGETFHLFPVVILKCHKIHTHNTDAVILLVTCKLYRLKFLEDDEMIITALKDTVRESVVWGVQSWTVIWVNDL